MEKSVCFVSVEKDKFRLFDFVVWFVFRVQAQWTEKRI